MVYILCTWFYWFRFLLTARSRRGVGSQRVQPALYYNSVSAESDPDFNLASAGSDEVQYHIKSSSSRDLPGQSNTGITHPLADPSNKRAVRILLECILVVKCHRDITKKEDISSEEELNWWRTVDCGRPVWNADERPVYFIWVCIQ